jgi:hypothetical protein
LLRDCITAGSAAEIKVLFPSTGLGIQGTSNLLVLYKKEVHDKRIWFERGKAPKPMYIEYIDQTASSVLHQ